MTVVLLVLVVYALGLLTGMLAAREARLFREQTRRGGELDLTGRRFDRGAP